MAAASARSRSLRRRPLASSTSPARNQGRRRGHACPCAERALTMTVSPSRVVFSWMTIVSAPGGSTPPVKMRAASPAPTAPSNGCPAATSPIELEPRRRAAPHRRRARHSRPWRRHRPAAACAAPRGRRRARGRAHRRAAAARPAAARRPRARARAPPRPASTPLPTPSPGSGRTCRRSSRSGGCLRCACRARPP